MRWAWAGLLVLLCAATYAAAPACGFIWDDDEYVTENAGLRSLPGLLRIWTDHHATPQYYPLTHTTLWVEYQLFGLNAAPYHVDNVILHALSACVLWLILLRLRVPGAWLAAAWFAVHPVHVESVAWVTERKNALSGLLYLSAAYLYLTRIDDREPSRSTRHAYIAVFALYIAAILAKTVTFTLPVALMLVVWWQRGRLARIDLTRLLPMQLVGLAPAALTAYIEKNEAGASWHVPLLDRIVLAGRNLWFYPQKIVWPQPVMFVYPRWHLPANAASSYLWGVAAIAIALLAWSLRARIGRGPLVAMLFYAITIAPALGMVNVYPLRYAPAADHFQYLASLGMTVLLAATLARFAARYLQARSQALLAGASVVAFGALSFQHVLAFHDPETLWRDSIARNPDAWLARANLANILIQSGRTKEALAHAQRGAAVAPESETLTALATAYGALGDHTSAVATLQHLIALQPDSRGPYTNLGVELRALGRLPEAEAALRTALRYRPDSALAHNNLANVLAQRGNPEALQHYAAAVQIEPGSAAYHGNYGMALQAAGRLPDAIAELQGSLAIDPRNSALRNNLAIALATSGDFPNAVAQFEQLVAANPSDARARANLARARALVH